MKTLRLFLIALTFSATACNITDSVSLNPSVSGTVVEASTNLPIEGVSITIANRTVKSRSDGRYAVLDLTKGTHSMKVEKAGYATLTQNVEVKDTFNEKKILLPRQ